MSASSPPPRSGSKRRRVFTAAVITSLIAPLALVTLGAQSASAAVPADPAVIFEEGFETGGSANATSLDAYVGAGATEYSSDPFWVNTSACNGVILQSQNTVFPAGWCADTSGTQTQTYVRALAEALGVLNGVASPELNHAVTAYTNENGGPTDFEMLRSESPVATLQAGHFYALSISVAEVNCTIGAVQSSLELGLGLASGDAVLNATPINVCAQGGIRTINVDGSNVEARIGNFTTPGYLATSAGDATVFLRNQQTGGGGNDMAYDNLRLLDVTPTLEKSFSDAAVEVGVPTTLTFTVTNTTDLQSKSGWSFTDDLPAGMVVAPTPNVVDNCGADVTAGAGDAEVAIAAGTIGQGVETCDISLDVVLESGGDFVNVIEGATGLDGQPSATIRGLVPSISIVKSASTDAITVSGQTVDYTFVVTNDGDVPLTDVVVADPGPVGGAGTMSAIDCAAQTTLDIDEVMTCTATYTSVAADLTAAPLSNTATADGVSPAGNRVAADSTVDVATAAAAPSLSLVKSASADSITKAGQVVTYSFLVTNTGNVEVADISVAEGTFTGHGKLSAVVCPADEAELLLPGEDVTCTATYTSVDADLKQNKIENTATAAGIGPDGGPVVSDPSTVALKTPGSGALATTGGETPAAAVLGAVLLLLIGTGLFAVRRRRLA